MSTTTPVIWTIVPVAPVFSTRGAVAGAAMLRSSPGADADSAWSAHTSNSMQKRLPGANPVG
jgi:hypothetical protein